MYCCGASSNSVDAPVVTGAKMYSVNAQPVTVRAMTAAEFEVATRRREREGVDALVEFMPEEQAWQRVREGTAFYLSDGPATERHHVLVAEDDAGVAVGDVWLGPDPNETTGTAAAGWIYDIFVYEQFRRRGYGSAILAATEGFARAEGMERIGLNVVGSNTAAIELYRRNAYQISSMVMNKNLTR